MPVYMVDRDLPGISRANLAALQHAALTMCQHFTARGQRVSYLRGMFIPGEDRCMCLFEAADEALVAAVNEVARLPFTRIVDALDLVPEPISCATLANIG